MIYLLSIAIFLAVSILFIFVLLILRAADVVKYPKLIDDFFELIDPIKKDVEDSPQKEVETTENEVDIYQSKFQGKLLERVSDITLKQMGGSYVVYKKDGDIVYIQKDDKNKYGGRYFIYGRIVGYDPLHKDNIEVMYRSDKNMDRSSYHQAMEILGLISSNADQCDVYD